MERFWVLIELISFRSFGSIVCFFSLFSLPFFGVVRMVFFFDLRFPDDFHIEYIFITVIATLFFLFLLRFVLDIEHIIVFNAVHQDFNGGVGGEGLVPSCWVVLYKI